MEKLSEIFNTVVQAGKDTVNGFNHTSVMSWLVAGFAGWNGLSTASALAAGAATAAILPGALTLLMAGQFWYQGRQSRLHGAPPRYIP